MSEFVVRPGREEELAWIGEVTVAAYRHDGHLADAGGYEAELRDAARRASEALVRAVLDGPGRRVGALQCGADGGGAPAVRAARLRPPPREGPSARCPASTCSPSPWSRSRANRHVDS